MIDDGQPGRGAIAFYFEAKKPGNDTATLLIDGTPYTYRFQVDELPAAGRAAAMHVYPDELHKGINSRTGREDRWTSARRRD